MRLLRPLTPALSHEGRGGKWVLLIRPLFTLKILAIDKYLIYQQNKSLIFFTMKEKLFAISVALSAAALPAYAGDGSIKDMHWAAPGFRTDMPAKVESPPLQKYKGLPDTGWTAPGFSSEDPAPLDGLPSARRIAPDVSGTGTDDTMDKIRHARDNQAASPRCKQETDLSNLQPGVWEICHNGRKSIASVTDVGVIDQQLAKYNKAEALIQARQEAFMALMASKCKKRGRWPGGIVNFAQGDKAYAIVSRAGYNEIQCR